MQLKDTALIEKRNVLNEIRSNNMTVQELRFFSIYLSKINPRDKATRVVRFPLSDFQRIMGFGRLNIKQLQQSTNSLLCKVVNIPDERGGYTGFTLFKKCRVSRDNCDNWYMEIDASDDALPLMFDFKNRYFKYELWNALRLKSANQVRMYEILKQYEHIGRRELTFDELRELLGIGKDEYSDRTGWSNFKKKVLDSCQQALAETTDIRFTYERGKVGKGGKWLTIVFYIEKNKDYIDQLTLDEYIAEQPPAEIIIEENAADVSSLCEMLTTDSFKGEFTPQQVQAIEYTILEYTTDDTLERTDEILNFCQEIYEELKAAFERGEYKLEHKGGTFFGYLKATIKQRAAEKRWGE